MRPPPIAARAASRARCATPPIGRRPCVSRGGDAARNRRDGSPARRRVAIRQAAPTQAVRARRSTIRLNRPGAPPRIGARLAVARAATQARL
ncbi:hypothetical protein VP95_19185 [Burkholderia pseudomallei]|nr:hypothetical protein VP95_19185 [Burkholderia pseudomallei]OND64048.1 hypothetical protein AQ937_06300 [Burkholderia pseudomallei]OND66375.1 hypothetical protein AQ936_00940 [Burkholderia pseudomallei]OND80178.1 hypothetical protein AQ939_27775 [Burkholderia pseudomallei]OND86368.1 hypothetical protein AQ940_24155 [Burkholderia pseudomallei]